MDVLRLIAEWHDAGKPYDKGLDIVKNLIPDNRAVIDLLEKYQNSFTVDKMDAVIYNHQKTFTANKAEGHVREKRQDFVITTSTPEKVKDLHYQKGQLYRKAGILHGKLMPMTPEQRGKAALEILEMMEQNDRIWEKLRYFDKHGQLPDVQTGITVDLSTYEIKDLAKLKGNLSSWLCRERVRISKEKNETKLAARKAKYDEKMKLYQSILSELK